MAVLQHLLQTHTQTHVETQIKHSSADEPSHKCRPASYPERVNAGLEVVGDGVRLEKGMVRDGAQGVVFAPEFLLQLQRLLEASLLGG